MPDYINSLLTSLSSLLVFGYLDDFTLGGGPIDDVAAKNEDVNFVCAEAGRLGLLLNDRKCEIIQSVISNTEPPEALQYFYRVQVQEATLLGAPLMLGLPWIPHLLLAVRTWSALQSS